MTTEERLESLEQELARVKRRTRRLLQGVVCLFATGCVFAVLISTMGSAKAQGEKVIRANKFVVEDQNGKTRVLLSVTNDGPSLSLSDQNEKIRTQLCAEKETGLTIFDQNGKGRAIVGTSKTTTSWGSWPSAAGRFRRTRG